jgi:metallo-beta-lactamase class B
MLKKTAIGLVLLACTVGTLGAQGGGGRQGGRGGRGGGGGQDERFPTAQEFAASAQAQQHVAAAMKIARTDLVEEAKAFCTPTGPQRPALARQAAGLPPIPDRLLEPIKFFDNLYYLGFSDVGAWAIPTSDGIIVFDALNNADEGRDVLAGGLKKVGLDPAQIKYLIVGHGHNDHTGGGLYLQNTYKPRVIMGTPDWATVVAGQRPDRPVMKRDMDAMDGQKVTLGDTTITIVLTPGHTPGTIGILVPARYQGRTHTVMILSGTQMPTTESLATFQHVFNDFAKKQNAESALSSHPDILMNKLPAMEAIGKQYPTGPHPFLYAPEKFSRYLDIMLECGRARIAAQAGGGATR